MIGYVCKYTPVHIIESFGEQAIKIDPHVRGFDKAETMMHPNICTYAKAVLEQCYKAGINNIVLVNCCDSIKRLYDVLKNDDDFKFVHMIDVPRKKNKASDCKFGTNNEASKQIRYKYCNYGIKNKEFNY